MYLDRTLAQRKAKSKVKVTHWASKGQGSVLTSLHYGTIAVHYVNSHVLSLHPVHCRRNSLFDSTLSVAMGLVGVWKIHWTCAVLG